MKKRVLFAVILFVLSLSLLGGCEVQQRAEYTAPTLTATETGIQITHEGAEKFCYSVDGGEWLSGNTVAYENVAGQHTVVAKVDDKMAKVAEEASFTYETKTVMLSNIEVKYGEDTATFSCNVVAKEVMIKDGGEYRKVETEGLLDYATQSFDLGLTTDQTLTVTVKAVGGYDANANVYFAGSEIEKSAQTYFAPAAQIATPVLTVNAEATGLTWTAVENATKYQLKVNDGEYQDATEYQFATEEGEYTVYVKAIGNGKKHLDSEVATFSYEVKKAQVTLEKTSATSVSWTVIGLSAEYKFGEGEYTVCEQTSYTATESGLLSVRALTGWDAANKVLYIESESTVASANLVVEASSAKLIEDAEGKSASDLIDEWEIKKYDNAWVDTTAKINLATNELDGSKAVMFDCWNNSIVFRYRKNYAVTGGYNAITFDIKGNGVSNVRLQLANSTSGVYTTIALGKIGSDWYKCTVLMSDSAWKINFSGTTYDLSQVISQIKMADTSEVISYCDSISFIFDGNTANGSSAKIYLDNLKFDNVEDKTSSMVQPLTKLGNLYKAKIEDVIFGIKITGQATATMVTCNLAENQSNNFAMALDMASATVSLTDATYGAAGLKIDAKFSANGSKVTVTEVTGQAAAQYQYLVGGVFEVVEHLCENICPECGKCLDKDCADATCKDKCPGHDPLKKEVQNLLIDFEDGTTGSAYTSALWIQEVYKDTGWQTPSSSKMNCREKDGSKVVNFAVGWSMAYRFTYLPEEAIGATDLITFKAGNYYTGAKAIKVKFILVDTNGNQYYVIGDSSQYESFPVTEGMIDMRIDLPATINVKAFVFVVNSSENNAYLYVDDIKFIHYEDIGGEEPEIKEVENLKIDFEDGTTGSAYTKADWKREKYTSSWETISGGMNCREKDGSKVVNFAVGYSTTYMFTYNPGTAIGKVDKISFKVGNYFSGAKEIGIKFVVVDASGNKIYLIGDANTFYQIPVTEGMVPQTLELPSTINVNYFYLVVKSNLSSGAYLYVDDIVFSHYEEVTGEEPTPTYPKLDVNETFDSVSSRPATVTGSNAGNIYFKTDSKGYEGSKNYLSINYKNCKQVVYTPSETGTATYLSVCLKNDHSSAGDVTLKLTIYGANGEVIGTDTKTLPAGTPWIKAEYNFPQEIVISKVTIDAETSISTDKYYYIDSIVIKNVD